MNLTDILIQQNNGAAVQELGQQFGLNQQQTVAAIEALMPAFSHGLKRQMHSTSSAAGLIEALAHGQHARYLDHPEYATARSGVSDGNAILGHLFGTKDVSRAVAAHASQSTGIGTAILKKMLPVIASMVMGALFKGATGRGGGLGKTLGQAAGGGILGQLIEGLAGGVLQGGRDATRPRRRRSRSRNPLEDLLGGMLGGGATAPRRRSREPVMPGGAARKRRRQPRGGQGGGFGDILDQLTGGQTRRRQNPYAPKPQRRTRTRRKGGLEEIFGDMLSPGGGTSQDYQRQTGGVFDEFLGPAR